MRKFNLERLEDESGVSGTGVVTEGYEFHTGICVMKWISDHSSVAVYANIEDVIVIHGHGGKTLVKWSDEDVYQKDLPLWAIDPLGYFEHQLTRENATDLPQAE